jgi:hypothetical protein
VGKVEVVVLVSAWNGGRERFVFVSCFSLLDGSGVDANMDGWDGWMGLRVMGFVCVT